MPLHGGQGHVHLGFGQEVETGEIEAVSRGGRRRNGPQGADLGAGQAGRYELVVIKGQQDLRLERLDCQRRARPDRLGARHRHLLPDNDARETLEAARPAPQWWMTGRVVHAAHHGTLAPQRPDTFVQVVVRLDQAVRQVSRSGVRHGRQVARRYRVVGPSGHAIRARPACPRFPSAASSDGSAFGSASGFAPRPCRSRTPCDHLRNHSLEHSHVTLGFLDRAVATGKPGSSLR